MVEAGAEADADGLVELVKVGVAVEIGLDAGFYDGAAVVEDAGVGLGDMEAEDVIGGVFLVGDDAGPALRIGSALVVDAEGAELGISGETVPVVGRGHALVDAVEVRRLGGCAIGGFLG